MSLQRHKVSRKRDGYLPLSGSVVESVPTPTGSVLAQNTAAVADPNFAPSGVPLVNSPAFTSSTSSTQSSAPTTSAKSPSSSSNQISVGTMIGACVAAFIALIFAVLLAIYCSKRQKRSAPYSNSRNLVNNVSRRRSHLEPWKRMNDVDRWEGQDQSMKQRPPSTTLGTMFQRTLSNASGEKSSETHNRESVGTMQHFAKYHPGLAAEMASQATITGVDGKVTKPPPVLHLMGRSSDVDMDTVGGESFMSLHSSWSNSTSPMMMAMAKSTPPATTSSLHCWESAEVVHVDQTGSAVSQDGELQNPFADSRASSIKSSSRGQNPFFSGRNYPARRTLLPDTQKNPFVDPDATRHSSAAIQSLIAALEKPSGRRNDRIISVQSSVYSRVTTDDGDSAITVAAFPSPPTQIVR